MYSLSALRNYFFSIGFLAGYLTSNAKLFKLNPLLKNLVEMHSSIEIILSFSYKFVLVSNLLRIEEYHLIKMININYPIDFVIFLQYRCLLLIKYTYTL